MQKSGKDENKTKQNNKKKKKNREEKEGYRHFLMTIEVKILNNHKVVLQNWLNARNPHTSLQHDYKKTNP